MGDDETESVDILAEFGSDPVDDNDRDVVSKWLNEFAPPFRIHILQELKGGLTKDEFNNRFKRNDQDTTPWDNLENLKEAQLVTEDDGADEKATMLYPTVLGRLFLEISDYLIGWSRVAERSEEFMRGLPPRTRIPFDDIDSNPFIPHVHGDQDSGLSLLARHADFDVDEDPELFLQHMHALKDWIDGKDQVKIFTPWPMGPAIDSFTQSQEARHEVIFTRKFIDEVESDSDTRQNKEFKELQNNDSVSVKRYSNRAPYLLATANASYSPSSSDYESLAIWGRGAPDDDYSIFAQTKHSEIVEWGTDLYSKIEKESSR